MNDNTVKVSFPLLLPPGYRFHHPQVLQRHNVALGVGSRSFLDSRGHRHHFPAVLASDRGYHRV